MDSSTSQSSERRHSVPEIILMKCKAHQSPESSKKKLKTRNKSIQTDTKVVNKNKKPWCHNNRLNCRQCSHYKKRSKRFKKINQNDLIDMIMKNNHVKFRGKYQKEKLNRKKSIHKKLDQYDKTDFKDNLQNFKDRKESLENQFVRLINEYPNSQLNITSADEEDSIVLAKLKMNPSINIKNKEEISSAENNKELQGSKEGIAFQRENKSIFEINDKSNEEYVIYFDNNCASSDDIQSLVQDSSNTMTIQSSSDYSLSPFDYSGTMTDRTVSTLSIKSSSSFIEEIFMKNVSTETDAIVNIPRSPRLFPLIIDTEGLLSEPLKTGYVPNTQMKLISVHFLDSDSDNTIGNKCLTIADQSKNTKCTKHDKNEKVVIYELPNEEPSNTNSIPDSDSNNVFQKCFISETGSQNNNFKEKEIKCTQQVGSPVIEKKKSSLKENNNTSEMSYQTCACNPIIGAVAPETYLDPVYPNAVPRLSALPKTYSMVVNVSSVNGDCSSDTSEVSNPDSLDEMIPRNKYDERIVRGDATPYIIERIPKKKVISFTPYFLTLNGDEIYNLPIVKYKLPDKIKSRIMNREKKLKRHSREICSYCTRSNLFKKLMRKKEQIKCLRKHKISLGKPSMVEKNANACKEICQNTEKNSENVKKSDGYIKCYEGFEKHTCSNTIVIHEVKAKEDNNEPHITKPECSSKKKNEGKKENHNGHRHTQIIKNECTQTSSRDKTQRSKNFESNFTQTSVDEDNIKPNDKQTQSGQENNCTKHKKDCEKCMFSSLKPKKDCVPRKVSIANPPVKVINKKESSSHNERKESCVHLSNKTLQKNYGTQTDASKSIQCNMDDIERKQEDEELDKKILYILLEGLVQNEKEEAERKISKTVQKDIDKNVCEMDKCPLHQDQDKYRRSSTSKFLGKFEVIPEENLQYMEEKNNRESTYRNKSFPSTSLQKNIQVSCGDEKKEITNYETYLMNKKKCKFYSEENQSYPVHHEVFHESVENRRHSGFGNSSLEISKANCRRHTIHGNNSTMLNYKRAMMVGTFTPYNKPEDGNKGKEAINGEHEELLTLSKGWINFYLLRGTDSQEFFSDPDDECVYSPNFDMEESYFKEEKKPTESFNVRVETKPETVLPTIPNKFYNKQSPDKKNIKSKSASLPKLNLRPSKPIPKPPLKKDMVRKKETPDIPKRQIINNKSKRNLEEVETRKNKFPNPKLNKSQLRNQKIEEETIESIEKFEQNKLKTNGFLKHQSEEFMGPLRRIDTPVDSYVSSPQLEDMDQMEYENSIRTISSVSVRSDSDDCQKQLIKKPDEPSKRTSPIHQDAPPEETSHQDPPQSENNWTVTVAGQSNKQSPSNIELRLSMNTSEQNRERICNKRQSNKMNFSLTLKNSYGGDLDMSPNRQDGFYDKDKNYSESKESISKKPYKKLTQTEETNSIRSSTVLSFQDNEDNIQFRDELISTKRDGSEGFLSVTGSLINPEKRRKPPTMSEKDLSLYKNSKKKDKEN